jgi:uncharacterized protein (TIGR02598 family)
MKTFDRAAGFSLVEVTLALGVAGFCLIAIFGLLPVALNSNQAAIQQTAANGIISSVIADLRATPSTTPPGAAATSKQFAINIPASGTAAEQTLFFNDERQLVPQAEARYRMTIAFASTPTGGGPRSASCATLRVTWPAPVDPSSGTRPAGSVSTFVALDRN